MSVWEEVRQLAADLQRVQASSTAHRLSERNCVELVGHLREAGLVSVLYTLDGKEYITPQQLEREVHNELTACRGRINVVDLQQVLNVDLSHVEEAVADLLKHDHGLVLLQGDIITRGYLNGLCEEINDTLQEVGQISIADLSRSFVLPMNFLLELVESALGGRISGQLDSTDSGLIYTDAYVSRYRSRIRGLLSAMTRPTAMGPIITQGGFQEKLFHSVVQELIGSGQLAGSLHGRLNKAVFIPEVYTQMQNKWSDSFLSASGYLEYDALSRLGIEDPRGYVAHRYGEEGGGAGVRSGVVMLETCCVGAGVVSAVEGAVEEVERVAGWADVLPLLPSPCSHADARILLQSVCGQRQAFQLFGPVVASKAFLQLCFDSFQTSIKDRAEKAAVTSAAFITQRALEEDGGARERRKKGGAGGRKGGRGKRGREREEPEGAQWELQFMTQKEVIEALVEHFPECPEEFLESVASELQRPLQESFVKEARACVASAGQTQPASHQRKRHANFQERVQGLWNSTCLFAKAITLFEGDSATPLSRYLLHSLCTDLSTMTLQYLAEDSGQTIPEEIGSKERAAIISHLPDHMRKKLSALSGSLNRREVGPFLHQFEEVCGEDYCGVMLRKLDKKKERQLLFSHQQSLLESLRAEEEPAMVLHLVTVLLFQHHTGHILHIPGRLVAIVVSHLKGLMSPKDHSKLLHYQQLVMRHLQSTQSCQSPGPPLEATPTSPGQELFGGGETPTGGGESGDTPTGGGEGDTPTGRGEGEELKALMSELKQLVPKMRKATDLE